MVNYNVYKMMINDHDIMLHGDTKRGFMSFIADIAVLDEALLKVDAIMGAAEAHGALCGMLCAQGSADLSEWVKHALGEQEQGNVFLQEAVRQMSELYQFTLEQISDVSGEFNLLLPDDDSNLSERTEALATWCLGFVYGLAAGGVTDKSELPDDTRELLYDFIEISRAGFDTLEQSSDVEMNEADEQAYMEVMEYVRTGARLISEELQSLQTTQTIH
jgi:uncharacterized protein YgfB (UPF0149 family)